MDIMSISCQKLNDFFLNVDTRLLKDMVVKENMNIFHIKGRGFFAFNANRDVVVAHRCLPNIYVNGGLYFCTNKFVMGLHKKNKDQPLPPFPKKGGDVSSGFLGAGRWG